MSFSQIESGEKSWLWLVILSCCGTDVPPEKMLGFRKTEIGSVGDIKKFGPKCTRVVSVMGVS